MYIILIKHLTILVFSVWNIWYSGKKRINSLSEDFREDTIKTIKTTLSTAIVRQYGICLGYIWPFRISTIDILSVYKYIMYLHSLWNIPEKLARGSHFLLFLKLVNIIFHIYRHCTYIFYLFQTKLQFSNMIFLNLHNNSDWCKWCIKVIGVYMSLWHSRWGKLPYLCKKKLIGTCCIVYFPWQDNHNNNIWWYT